MSIYIFDNNSISILIKHFYESRFPSLWTRIDELVNGGQMVSVKEVHRELNAIFEYNPFVKRETIEGKFFKPANEKELLLVRDIFLNKRFQDLVSRKNILRGAPVADPFLIAKAECCSGVVVTQEEYKPNGVKIPNVCEERKVDCINLETFMERQNWVF